MSDMKFKFTIQPYQTEAVESVVGVFAGQPFNDHFTYRRDVEIERDITNYMLFDEELYMGFANARVALDYSQLLENIRKMQTRNNTSCRTPSPPAEWAPALLTWRWKPAPARPMCI